MWTRACVVGLLGVGGACLGPFVALGEWHAPRGAGQEPSPWRAIAELRREVQSLRTRLDDACRAPTSAGDLTAQLSTTAS